MITHYIVFARFPELGTVKTRLAASLGDHNTLALYEAMLRDTLEIVQSRASATNADVLLFVAPDREGKQSSVERFKPWLEQHHIDYLNVHIFPQEGATLGDRMNNAFRVAASRDALPAIILGTDSPTIPDTVFVQAEHALNDPDTATIGKTTDGGFYMMGLQRVDERADKRANERANQHFDSLFFGADYSNETVYERTLAALNKAYKRVVTMPAWYDIDDAAALERLRSDAAHDTTLKSFHTLRVLEILRGADTARAENL